MAHAKKSSNSPNQPTPLMVNKRDYHFVETKKYRFIPQSAGGTLVIDNQQGGIKRIGTFGCQRSLGALFTIDDQRVFCAHMTVSDTSMLLSKARGEELCDRVCGRLQGLKTTEGWAVEHKQFGVGMILMCKRLLRMSHLGTEVAKTASWWMAEGVRKFMGQCHIELSNSNLPEVDEEYWRLNRHWQVFGKWVRDLKVNQDGEGVVVDVGPEVDIVIIECNDGSAFNLNTGEVDTSSYVPKEETMEAGEWCFSLDSNSSLVKEKQSSGETGDPPIGAEPKVFV